MMSQTYYIDHHHHHQDMSISSPFTSNTSPWYHPTQQTGYYQPSPLTGAGDPSSPSQMETSSYLPAYLLGGAATSSPTPPRHGTKQSLHFQGPSQQKHTVGSPMTMSSTRSNRKIHDVKPGGRGGPPVQTLHDPPSNTPLKPHPHVGMSTPERRQLSFSGANTFDHTPSSMTTTRSPPSNTSAYKQQQNGLINPSPVSPAQMDPFYTQGELVNSDSAVNDKWVTVFGFPPSSTSYMLEQFAQYGTIISHKISSEGNWIHIQYQTKLQAKKALSKNGRIYGDGIMIGVQSCIDQNIIDGSSTDTDVLPNSSMGGLSPSKPKPSTIRPLSAAYHASSATHGVAPSNPNTPQKSSSFISRTLEYVFGW